MLVLTRQPDETVMIGDDIEITVVHIQGRKVRLGISAPPEVSVFRKEVWKLIQSAGRRHRDGSGPAAAGHDRGFSGSPGHEGESSHAAEIS